MFKTVLGFGLVAALSLVLAVPALAQVDVNATGEVVAIDAVTGNFQLDSEGDLYTVIPPEGFDLATLSVGASVQVQGTLEDSTITAASVEILPPEEEEEEAKEGFYCRTPEARHPALNGLAVVYDQPYEVLLGYFCEGRFGVGNIMLALQTAAVLDNGMDAGDILALKAELGGWGQVWRPFGLKGGK